MTARLPTFAHCRKRPRTQSFSIVTALPSAAAAHPRVPPHAYFLVSATFHYLGPAFAVLLFVRVDVLGVAWLRIAAAAVVLGLWRRPWRLPLTARFSPGAPCWPS